MKQIALLVTFCLSAVRPLLADGTNALADDKSRLSYAIGMMFADRWKEQGVDVDPDLVLRGLKDGQAGGPTLMSRQDTQALISKFNGELAARQQKMREELIAKNKAAGEAFLAKNRTQPGVVTLPDGLQYQVLNEGRANGEAPDNDAVALVNYHGTLVDGTVFGDSFRDGKPAEIPVGQAFRGLSEGLKLMKTGAKWRLVIPPDLAYGAAGSGARIPPNATLIIDVELLSIERPKALTAVVPPAPAGQPLTSDIIKVQGTNVQVLKPEDLKKLQQSQSAPAK